MIAGDGRFIKFSSRNSGESSDLNALVQRRSDALFDAVMYDEEGGLLSDDEISERIHRNYSSISEYVDNVYGLLNSTKDGDVYDNCMDVIEKWRYFLHSNGHRLNNHTYDLRTFINSDRADIKSVIDFHVVAQGGISNNGRLITGFATRDSYEKTVPINTVRQFKDNRTGKYIKRSKRYLIHDEFNIVSRGSKVIAVECRPISARKSFRLLACS